LNRAARKQIWQDFLDVLGEDEEHINFGEIIMQGQWVIDTGLGREDALSLLLQDDH